ncbi:chemotaxis protein CheX [Peredibacter sp. HCB2-198]|uniref:chemotaxis protein CheX n=1 Tax=Peredibacter sp. HCB2-198 TaxID=3383025 RepID=UPI0038B69746
MVNTPGFLIEKEEGYTVVKLSGNLEFPHAKSFEGEIDGISNNADGHIFLDCEHLTSFSKDWIRIFLRLQINLKSNEKSLKLIHVSPGLMTLLKKEGIDSTFKIASTLKDAMDESGAPPKRTLDTEFINPFLTATLHVLSVQAQITAKAGPIYKKKPTDSFYGDVSGVIGIVSDAFNGSVVISFPEKTFLNIMSGMLGEEYTEITKDILDGAGEITNMIFGQAKVVLNEKGYGIKTAIPSVISGKDHSLQGITKGPVIVVPFESTGGNFFVEICLSA